MSTSDSLTIVGFVITLGVAFVGWVWLRRANRQSREANEHAAAANDMAAQALELARTSEERAQRADQRASENPAVAWERREMTNRDGVAFFNAGTDQAHLVELTVSARDGSWSRTQEHGAVAHLGRIAMDLTTELGERRDRWERASATGMAPNFARELAVRVHISWSSTSGQRFHTNIDRVVL